MSLCVFVANPFSFSITHQGAVNRNVTSLVTGSVALALLRLT